MSVWDTMSMRREPKPSGASFSDRARLAMQAALVGQITPTMRLISVEPDAASVRVVVFFDGTLPDEDRAEFEEEVASCVGLKLGDPPLGPSVACYYVRCDAPQRVPVRGEVVFSRKGVLVF
jgi:hypothetical protein